MASSPRTPASRPYGSASGLRGGASGARGGATGPHAGAPRSGARRPASRPHTHVRNAGASSRRMARAEPAAGTGRSTADERTGPAGRAGKGGSSSSRRQPRTLLGLGRLSLTSRAFILAAAVVMVIVMITPSLGVYFKQRSELADLTAQQAQTSQSIDSLRDELERWDDPDYVRSQARSQLGWVVPGETGFRVIGKDGKVMGPGAELDAAGATATTTATSPWWQKLTGSVRTADKPVATTGKR
ncbi:FtsB family cell division protein [Acidipropionibacterium jensenii]|uniref:FtsB family cell division protein n=1 Tax=Acidipropionibacterium jensenii TaxID=1749 RepID=UPI00214B157D|nr:septum formation initiator family protein [Acidipropionibacterium jensenii]